MQPLLEEAHPMPNTDFRLPIDEICLLDDEPALFDAGLDPYALQIAADQIIISLIINP
jgi:hypothetical protein